MSYKRRKQEVTPPFASMADLAFNLVLFFIMMAKTQDDGLQWDPANASETRQVPNSKVIITVDKDSKVYLNGKAVSTNDLAERIEKELENSESRAVLLKIHKETLASTFDPIMEAVGKSGSELYHVLNEEN